MSAPTVANNPDTTDVDTDRQDNTRASEGPFELTLLTKHGGPLSKRISLGADGKPVSDGSVCCMQTGTAKRVKPAGLH